MLQKMEKELKTIWTMAMNQKSQEEKQRLITKYYELYGRYKKQRMMEV